MVCLQTSTELKKEIYTKYVQNKTKETTFEDIDFSDFPSFIFKASVEKVVIDEEKLRDIDIDGILNLKYLSRTVFIN